jgi:poly(A) polymerase
MDEFSGKLSKQAWMVAPETVKVMDALQENGAAARFVGGCVRDALINRKILDIDIATPLKPDEVIERLSRHQIKHAPTGLRHGTVTAIVDGHSFEITTLRVDTQHFGRHAEVAFTDDWQADAARRDFTINAMSATIEGEVFDPFHGVEDLRLGRIIFVGDPEKRIREDILRILRYFRFLAHFGQGEPDVAAVKACAALAPLIPKLSAERIRQEIFKLLESDNCAAVWQLMLENGIITQCLPEGTNVAALKKMVALEIEYHSQSFALRRLAAVLDVTPEGIKDIVEALRLSNEQGTLLFKMLFLLPDIPASPDTAAVKRMVYRLGNDMARNLLLLRVAKGTPLDNLSDLYEVATAFRPPRFPLIGDDVMKLGYPSGAEVGKILAALQDWWIAEDFIPTRRVCLEKLQKEYTTV